MWAVIYSNWLNIEGRNLTLNIGSSWNAGSWYKRDIEWTGTPFVSGVSK